VAETILKIIIFFANFNDISGQAGCKIVQAQRSALPAHKIRLNLEDEFEGEW